MASIKIALLLIYVYLLVLVQYSFLPFFDIKGITPNIILIFVCLWNFFEKAEKKTGILISVAAGLFLDFFFGYFVGISTILFLVLSIVFKKSHWILRDSQKKYPFTYFSSLFIIAFFFYNFALRATLFFLESTSFKFNLFFEFGYNFLLATILFFLFKKIFLKILN